MITIAATHKKPRPLGEVAPQGDGEGAPKRCEYVILTEQKARTTYDNILRLVDDPDVREPIKFLRAREIVHYQRFGDALRIAQDQLDSKNFYAINPSFDKGMKR